MISGKTTLLLRSSCNQCNIFDFILQGFYIIYGRRYIGRTNIGVFEIKRLNYIKTIYNNERITIATAMVIQKDSERSVGVVNQTLQKAHEAKDDTAIVLLCLRTTPIETRLPSTAELLFSGKIQSNLPSPPRGKSTFQQKRPIATII